MVQLEHWQNDDITVQDLYFVIVTLQITRTLNRDASQTLQNDSVANHKNSKMLLELFRMQIWNSYTLNGMNEFVKKGAYLQFVMG